MKYLVLIFALLASDIIAQTITLNTSAWQHYQTLENIKRQQEIINAKIQLAKTYQMCQKLNINCDITDNIESLTKQASPNIVNPVQLKQSLPSLIGIVNNHASFITQDRLVHVAVGDFISTYRLISVQPYYAILKDEVSGQYHKLDLFWQGEQ